MEYQVPQFIEVEDKIIGPFTLKQFIYLAGGAGLLVVLFIYLPLYAAIPLGLPVLILTLALAFYKLNGKSFIEILEAGFNYYIGAKLFLWRHEDSKKQVVVQRMPEATVGPKTPRLTRGKLQELAWALDVKKPGGNPDDLES